MTSDGSQVLYDRTYVRYARGMQAPSGFRWRLAGTDGQASLFGDEEELGRDLPGVDYLHVRARSVISRVPAASRMPFRYTINAYRGCAHACVYCFARPTHEHLGLGAGEDFERRIVVKVNAVERVRAELASPRWAREPIAMGTNTDPYQPAEGRYRLTRGIIEALLERDNPFSILTKSTMIVRDLDLLEGGARRGLVRASMSIGTLDPEVARTTEPGAPPPARRLAALARLAEAGIPTGVLVAPILPGLSDSPDQIDAVVKACLQAGAGSVTGLVLHLRPGVREVFMPWLEGHSPALARRYASMYASRSGYLPAPASQQVGDRVRRAVAAHRQGLPLPV